MKPFQVASQGVRCGALMITREHVIRVLEGALNALEGQEAENEVSQKGKDKAAQAAEDNAANALHQVLLLLIDGLEKLEKGEVPPIFAPSKVKERGKRPATLWQGRLTAIVAVSVLRRRGHSAEKAIEIVAKAYGVSTDAIRQWRKTLGKDADSKAQMLKAEMRLSIFHLTKTKQGLLTAVARAGQAFRDAQEKKGKG
jgi:hypothetical protein